MSPRAHGNPSSRLVGRPPGRSVEPFHSRNTGRPLVYHDRTDCFAGRQIPAHNRKPGTGGYPRCQHCVEIARELG